MSGIFVFSGTADGRRLSELLASRGLEVHARVATEYGATVMDGDGVDVAVGSCGGAEGIARTIRENGYTLVIDATHPYARRISEHIREGCREAGVECIRMLREGGTCGDDVVSVPSVKDAVDYLMDKDGTILASTGSNELAEYTRIPDYRKRVVARILSTRDSAEKAFALGFEGRNLIAAQGPFTEGENLAALERSGAEWLVTKDSGTVGGFEDKIRAARKAGAKVVLISKPEESGYSFKEVVRMVEDRFGMEHSNVEEQTARRKLVLIGIGMGPGDLTQRAAERLKDSDLIIGAKRMLESVDAAGVDTLVEYKADVIAEYLDAHPEYANIACLMSGDTGFYSGTKQILARIDRERFDISVEPGISSVVYLASKLGETWQDVFLTSAHGRSSNIVGLSRTHPKVFTLLSGEESVRSLCSLLIEYGMDVDVAIGQDFGYPTERIVRGSPSDLVGLSYGDLCVAMIINRDPDTSVPLYIPDEEFIRGDAPMTKSEVRTLSVAKLKLRPDSVVYDVGAGTGSVSVEIALAAVEGTVYAIEKEDAAADLIEENKRKFKTPNIEVVRGTAPEALDDLPLPTHAFIGGSSGNLKQIVECLLSKNPDIRIVINSVTIETLDETMAVIRDLGLAEEDIANVSIAKGRKLGRYHLMTAQNPVYIAVVRGR